MSDASCAGRLMSVVSLRHMRTLKVYLLIARYMIAPILTVMVSSGIANATGSRLDEAGPHPCIILGVDVGISLNAMFVAGWLVFFTVPTGLLAIVVVSIVRGLRRRKANTL
jgi:hypothetical protein